MRQTIREKSRRRGVILLAIASCIAVTTGCENVAFYEKGAFANPQMTAEDGPDELHWRQKVHYSREASIGGMGKTAGGGCGCY